MLLTENLRIKVTVLLGDSACICQSADLDALVVTLMYFTKELALRGYRYRAGKEVSITGHCGCGRWQQCCAHGSILAPAAISIGIFQNGRYSSWAL